MRCDYCGHQVETDLEIRGGRVACRDIGACDERDARSHAKKIAQLRKMQREGEELTEAQKMEMAEMAESTE